MTSLCNGEGLNRSCSIRKRPDQTSVCAQKEDRMEVSVIRRRVCFCSHDDDDDEY